MNNVLKSIYMPKKFIGILLLLPISIFGIIMSIVAIITVKDMSAEEIISRSSFYIIFIVAELCFLWMAYTGVQLIREK